MPEITSVSDNQRLNEGDNVSLNCTADGYPTPTVTWTKVSDNSLVSFHSVGALDESHEGEASQSLMFCFDNGYTEKSCFVVDLVCFI